MKEQVTSQGLVFLDTGDDEVKSRVANFVAELDMILGGNKEVTLVLDDPAGNSYVQVTAEMESNMYLYVCLYILCGLWL
jgi:zinc finger protein